MITLIQISVIVFNNTTTNLAMLINPSRIVSVKSFASFTRLSYISKTDGFIDTIIINETFSSFKSRTGDYNAGVTITLPIIALGDTINTELLVDNITSVIDNADIPGQSIIQYIEYNVLTQKSVVMTMADILALANAQVEPVKMPARAGTTANINLAVGPALIDGVALVVGDRVLVKNQAAGQENGIYVWNGLGVPMTRSEDFDIDSEVLAGTLIVVSEGLLNEDTLFVLATDNPIVVGVTPLVFQGLAVMPGAVVVSVSGTLNRITSTGGINPVIDISAGYVGQTSITTLGTITTATWNATAIGAIYGGTGQTTYALGDMLYASGVNTLSKLAAGADNQTLVISGGVPTWQNYSLVPPLSAVLAAGNTTGANDISVNSGRKIFSVAGTQTIDQVFSGTDWYVDANDSATNKEGLLTVSSFDASVDLYSADGVNGSHLTNFVDYGVITSDKATYQGYKYEALTSLAVGANGNQYTIFDRRYNDLRYAAIGSFETLAQTMTAGRLADVTGTIYDSSNVLAIHIAAGLTVGSRILYDEVGTASVKWRERILWTSSDKAADWASRDLFVVGGATSSLNWGTRTLSVGAWSYGANYAPFSGQQIPDASWVSANFAPISVTNALTSTYIGYGSGANVLTGDTNFTWDAANQDFKAGSGAAIQVKMTNSTNTFWAAQGDAGYWYVGPTASSSLLAHRGFGVNLKTTEWYRMGDSQPGGIYFEVNKSSLQYKLSTFTGGGTLMLTVDNTGIIGTAAVPAGGTVTSVSVVSANGFAGTVATATTTPAITLTTSISGVLKGSASALAAATSADITSFLLTGLVVSGGAIVAGDTILQAFGKTQSQINALLGGVNYQGVWNANTNTPALASGAGTKGYYYVVSVAGATNLDGITDWKLGDWAIFNGTTWDKVDNTDAVISVNGLTGAVALTGTVNRITVSAGNVFDISASYVGQTSITTLGTLTTGTWNASVIGAVYGGTSQSTYATGDTLYASGINALSKLAAGTVGQVLTMAGGVPTWATPTTGTVTSVAWTTSQGVSASIATATTTPNITVTLGALTGVTSFNGLVITPNTGAITTGSWAATTIGATVGGTAQTTYATGDTLYASAANTLSKLGIGTAGQVLTVVAGIPSWVTPTGGGVTSVSGTLNRITSTGGATPVIDIAAAYVGQNSITTLGTITTGAWTGTGIGTGYGGTGWTTYTTGDTLYASTTGFAAVISKLAIGIAGQVLTVSGGVPVWATPTTGVTGSGTTNTLTKWTSSSAIGNSLSTDDGSTFTLGGVAKLSGYISNSTIVVSSLAADATNWSLGIASYFYVEGTAARTIQGIVAPTISTTGTEITLINRGTFNLTFIQNSTTCTNVNRLYMTTGADNSTGLVLQPQMSVTFVYDGGFAGGARWRIKQLSTTVTPNTNSLDQSSRVTSQFDKVSNTTLGSITGLTATLIAGRKYAIEVDLYVTTTSAGGQKVDMGGGTATATSFAGQASLYENTLSGVVWTQLTALTTTSQQGGSGGTPMHIHISATIVCNAAGTLIPRFAQNSASGTSSVIVNSRMIVKEII